MVNAEDELPYVDKFDNSGVKEYMSSYSDLVNNWNTSNNLILLVVRNKPNTHLKEKNYALEDYKKKYR